MKFNQKNFAIIQNKHIFVSANLKYSQKLDETYDYKKI